MIIKVVKKEVLTGKLTGVVVPVLEEEKKINRGGLNFR